MGRGPAFLSGFRRNVSESCIIATFFNYGSVEGMVFREHCAMSFTTLSGRRLAYGRKQIEWLAIEIERGTVARLSAIPRRSSALPCRLNRTTTFRAAMPTDLAFHSDDLLGL